VAALTAGGGLEIARCGMARNGCRVGRPVVVGLLAVATIVLGGGRILGQGGTWSTKASMPTARQGLGVGVIDGILYAVGGVSITKSTNIYLNTVEAYDPSTNTWSTKASMPTAREGLGVGVINGILYAVGGNGTSTHLTTVEAYDRSTNTWSTKASMPAGRDGLSVGIINGILYAVGGNGASADLNTVEAYDPSSNTWSTKASMPTGREGIGVGVINGILYAVGGSAGPTGFLNTVEAYDPSTSTWSKAPSLSTKRAFSGVGVANGVLYVVGGAINFGFLSINTVEAL